MNIIPGKLYAINGSKSIKNIIYQYSTLGYVLDNRLIQNIDVPFLCTRIINCSIHDTCLNADACLDENCEYFCEFLYKNKIFRLRNKFVIIKYHKKILINGKEDFVPKTEVHYLSSELKML